MSADSMDSMKTAGRAFWYRSAWLYCFHIHAIMFCRSGMLYCLICWCACGFNSFILPLTRWAIQAVGIPAVGGDDARIYTELLGRSVDDGWHSTSFGIQVSLMATLSSTSLSSGDLMILR